MIFGSAPGCIGVWEDCRGKDGAHKVVVFTEAKNFFFIKITPFTPKPSPIIILGLKQAALPMSAPQKPKLSYEVMAALKSAVVKALLAFQFLSKIGIGLNKPTGVEVAFSWLAIQESDQVWVQPVLNIHQHPVRITQNLLPTHTRFVSLRAARLLAVLLRVCFGGIDLETNFRPFLHAAIPKVRLRIVLSEGLLA